MPDMENMAQQIQFHQSKLIICILYNGSNSISASGSNILRLSIFYLIPLLRENVAYKLMKGVMIGMEFSDYFHQFFCIITPSIADSKEHYSQKTQIAIRRLLAAL